MDKVTNCFCMSVLCAQAGKCLKENQAYTQPATVQTYFEPIKLVPTEQDIKQAERIVLFKQVAVQLIPCLVPNEKEWIKNKDLIQKARGLTEAILSAADEFAKGKK